MTDRQKSLLEDYQDSVLGVFGTPQIVLERGEGVYVTDVDGTRYLDLLAGIAVNSVGHAHPEWVRAVSEQAGTLAHISNLFTSPAQIHLARKLVEVTGLPEGSRVFLANSGSEANEAAFKLARRHGTEHPDARGNPRTTVVALEGAFHGRTMGAVALTAKEAYRSPFEPLPSGVVHVPATVEALEAVMDDTVSALVLEPVQGEAGVHPLPDGFLARARELTREHGALLVADEVQTGIGRTGHWLASSAYLPDGEFPDAVTLAKGLGGGFPVGALVTVGPEVSGLLGAGQHGTTFGGNPLAATAACATLDIIQDQALVENAATVGEHAARALRAVPGVAAVRQAGLLIGVDLDQDVPDQAIAPAVVTAARDAGFIINATGPATVRIAPPLIITAEQLDTFVAALPQLLRTARAATTS